MRAEVRRLGRAVLTLALLMTGWWTVLPAADACACGGVFVEASASSSVSAETALVVHSGSRESITMRLNISSTASEAGLVVPTPQPATVDLADRNTFTALQRLTAPVHKTRTHLVGGGEGNRTGNGAPPQSTAGGVRVLSSVDLGPLKATTLKAGDAAALRKWLSEHQYVVRPEVQTVLDSYVAQGWSFVAMQLTPQGAALAGDLPPIRMRFASDSVVYPMRMSQAASVGATITTYVISDHRMERTDPTREQAPVTTFFAGPVTDRSGLPDDLRSALAADAYLTASRQTLTSPGTQVRSDFTFDAAPSDQPYREVIWEDKYLMTPGQLMLVIVLLGVGGAGGFALAKSLRARRG